MYRRCYSVNDMPHIRDASVVGEVDKKASDVHKSIEEKSGFIKDGKILGKFEIDDVILIVIAIILLADDCDDKLLLLALGFIFLSGIA